jgi:hypothetical protein
MVKSRGMPARPHIEDPKLLDDQLREILVTGSLYRNFVYTGTNCHSSNGTSRYGRLPKQLRMFCDHEKCKAPTWWQADDTTVYFSSGFIRGCNYTCRNCGEREQYYHFIWQENANGNIFIKVGQWPPLTIEPSPELVKALGPEDAGLYKKGLIDFNFGHGIGAVGYFRRVLENKINDLLDLIAEAARNANVPADQIAEIEAAKKKHRVEERIDIASAILPSYLRPGGHNPLVPTNNFV